MSTSARQVLNEILREGGAPPDEGIPDEYIPCFDFGDNPEDNDLLDVSHAGGEMQELELVFRESFVRVA
jgi:hypothetical protein